MPDCGQGPRAGLGLQASGNERLVDRRWQFPGQLAIGIAADHMVDHELQDGGLGHRQRQLDPITGGVPAGPVAQRAGVAARGVGGGRLGEQFSHRIGSLFGQLIGQGQAGGWLREGRNRGNIFHSMYVLLR